MARRGSVRESSRNGSLPADSIALPALPYVVRFGPWARNLYLGLPAAATFLLIGVVADMPGWFRYAWDGVIAVLVYICALPREVRIYPDRVLVLRRLLALIPLWMRRYARSDFRAVTQGQGAHAFVGEAEIRAQTVYLVLRSGKLVPVQSYSSGADNQPPQAQLVRELMLVMGLPQV